MTNTIETLQAESKAVMFDETHDIARAKALYEEVLALVPEHLTEFVRPGFTGTIESRKAYTMGRYPLESAEWHEWNAYREVAYAIVNLIQGTLGLRD